MGCEDEGFHHWRNSRWTEWHHAGVGVSAVAWSPERGGYLSIAIGGTIKTYDTKAPGSRSLPVEVSYISGDEDGFLQDLAFQPQVFCRTKPSSIMLPKYGTDTSDFKHGDVNPFEFYPNRILVVSSKGDTDLIPESYVSPLAVSKRDGRIAHSLGSYVWIGDTTQGGDKCQFHMRFKFAFTIIVLITIFYL